jgi:hypothetical protein
MHRHVDYFGTPQPDLMQRTVSPLIILAPMAFPTPGVTKSPTQTDNFYGRLALPGVHLSMYPIATI